MPRICYINSANSKHICIKVLNISNREFIFFFMAYQLFVGYLKPKVLLDCKNFGAIIKRFTNTNPN